MGYANKLQSDGATAPLLVCMAQRHHSEAGVRATESKFYLPAGVPSSFFAGRFESIWAALFNHQVGTSK